MRALRLYGPQDLRLVEEARPTIGPDEALLRVRAVTVCHSDIHYYRYGRIGDTVSDKPLILGHEFAAEVVDVYPGVQRVKVGDLVAAEPALSCGHCRYCQEGNPNLCQNLLFAGTPPMDGALRDYVAYKAEFLFPLPLTLSAEEGALLEPLGVAIHAWDLAKLRIGETLAVVGCGPIGLLLVQLARVGGATRVLAVDPLPYRRDLAAEMGAIPLDPQEDLAARAEEYTGGHGVDVAIEAAGVMAAQEEAAQMVKRGGRMVLVGIPAEDRLLLTHHLVRRKGLTIKLSRRMKLTYPRAIALVERGMVNLRSLITHHFPLERAAEAFRLVESYGDGVVKAVICP
jgi:L-iditol 2-dehydrogenase